MLRNPIIWIFIWLAIFPLALWIERKAPGKHWHMIIWVCLWMVVLSVGPGWTAALFLGIAGGLEWDGICVRARRHTFYYVSDRNAEIACEIPSGNVQRRLPGGSWG